MKVQLRLFLCLLLGWAVSPVSAQEPVPAEPSAHSVPQDLKFGFEITVTSELLHYYSKNLTWDQKKAAYRSIIEGIAAELKREFPKAVVHPYQNVLGINVEVSPGRILSVGTDPNVIEIRPSPQTLATIPVEIGGLFRALSRLGYRSELGWGGHGGGGGHIHVDGTLFKKDPLLLRNLQVDLYNRPFLAAVLNTLGDHKNAPGIREQGNEPSFLKRLRAVDQGGGYVWSEVLALPHPSGTGIRSSHYSRYSEINLNLTEDLSKSTVELRAIRVQHNIQDAYDTVLLLHRYLSRLQQVRQPIPPLSLSAEQVLLETTPTVAGERWKEFIRNLGLDPVRYERFVETKFPPSISFPGSADVQARLMDFNYSEDFVNRDIVPLGPKTYRFELMVRGLPPGSEVAVDGRKIPMQGMSGLRGEGAIGVFDVPAERAPFTVEIRVTDDLGNSIEKWSGSWRLAGPAGPLARRQVPSYLPRIGISIPDPRDPRDPARDLVRIESAPRGRRYPRLRIVNLAPGSVVGVQIGSRRYSLTAGEVMIPTPGSAGSAGSVPIRLLSVEGSPVPLWEGSLNLMTGGVEGLPPSAGPKREGTLTRLMDRFRVPDTKGIRIMSPGKDPVLEESLRRLERITTECGRPAAVARAIRTGRIRVIEAGGYAAQDPFIGRSGAWNLGDLIVVRPGRMVDVLTMELVHEGTQVLGFLEGGRPATEREAFRAEAEFAEAARRQEGLRLRAAIPSALRETDAVLEETIRKRWPELYDRGPAGVDRWTRTLKRGAAGAGTFSGGLLLKGTLEGKGRETLHQIVSPWFVADFAVFSAASHLAERGLRADGMAGALRTFSRMTLPLYAGMGAVHAIHGSGDVRAMVTETAAFAGSLAALSPLDLLLHRSTLHSRLLVTPWGRVGLVGIEIAKSALVLEGAERLGAGLRR